MKARRLRPAILAVVVAVVAIFLLSRPNSPKRTRSLARTSPTTTDGEIAVRNLDAEIGGTEARLAANPEDISIRAGLVPLLLLRADILGRQADRERAADIGETCVEKRPEDPSAYRTRAWARAAIHRFEDALADLARAETLGDRSPTIARARASVLAAQGKLDDALALLPKDEATLDMDGAAALGALYGELNRAEDATHLFMLARRRYRDVSPFPLARIDYREADLLERRRRADLSLPYYESAVARIPRYTPAATHLAAQLAPEKALATLERVAERSDDPEVDVARAAVLRRLGRNAEADVAVADAGRRYDALTAKWEAAFADHAARFWLGPGNDVPKAHRLALANLATRETSAAFDLALTTAVAAKKYDDACAIAARAKSLAHADAPLRGFALSVAKKCE